ncbi:MAG: DUF2723 domain-containing protein [Saprospiraceae bacterium]|nr:DUF2723 domain-containing protein [Saprospiraceae bacterium]MBK6814997.1 DUF2723 domain-containing protein [Saprospiraceae bacterium]
MFSFKKQSNLAGWVVFAVAFAVYFVCAERSGSLWDCGEFILGAAKLQVVHPPGAPLFILVGRLFAWVGSLVSSNPSAPAFAVNLMSAMCTAFAATFFCWSAIILAKLAWLGRDKDADTEQGWVLAAVGVVTGLTGAFCTSVWFSAVEGEVYAMSTFFTGLTIWTALKWYYLPTSSQNEKWLVLCLFVAALSIGVHLLSLLAFPFLGLLYYYKRFQNHNLRGAALSILGSLVALALYQKLVIVGLPQLWSTFDYMMVNGLGMPFHSGIFPFLLLIGAGLYYGIHYANKHSNAIVQNVMVTTLLIILGFSTVAVVVIRANADTPINMNSPTDAMRLIPYLNREQYGDRPLLKGPAYYSSPIRYESDDRYGRVGDRYEVVDKKYTPIYKSSDEKFFPRMGHTDRATLYQYWMDGKTRPTQADNMSFFVRYQVMWMYWRYFMWNFVGRENFDQGYFPWNLKSGHWLSGIKPIDEARLYNMEEEPVRMKTDPGRNKYYFIPLLFGIMGLLWHYKNNKRDFLALLMLFIITGIGIIIYSNEPPNEPRERDYVLVGSFLTFSIWVGMGVIYLYQFLAAKMKGSRMIPVAISAGLGLVAPLLMVTSGIDDHSRQHLSGSRDYANNFLESCAPNAILFTYGDNDTYPLWYAQEMEGIRTDVRVINLSLIAVDWYINQVRRKINKSDPVKLSISEENYRGDSRMQLVINAPEGTTRSAYDVLKFANEKHPLPLQGGQTMETYIPARKVIIPIDRAKALAVGMITPADTNVANQIEISLSGNYIMKDDLAVLDIIASNIYERPIYFATTANPDKLIGLNNYSQLEGMATRIVPILSTPDGRFGSYGAGRVAGDIIYDNVIKKFQWGGFDKYKMFNFANSFNPSFSAMRIAFMRGIDNLIKSGQMKKAEDLNDQYFKAFPQKNFEYDSQRLVFIEFYYQMSQLAKCKEESLKLAAEAAEYLNFYNSLSPEDLEAGFKEDYNQYMSIPPRLLTLANQMQDPAFEKQIADLVGKYTTTPVKR